MADQPNNIKQTIHTLCTQIETSLSSLVTDYKNCLIDPFNLDNIRKGLHV